VCSFLFQVPFIGLFYFFGIFIFSSTAYCARSLTSFPVSSLWLNLNCDAFDGNCFAVVFEKYCSRWYLNAALPFVIVASAVVVCLVSLRQTPAFATMESRNNRAAGRLLHKRKKSESAANNFRASLEHATDGHGALHWHP
jgi:hypothetical protein